MTSDEVSRILHDRGTCLLYFCSRHRSGRCPCMGARSCWVSNTRCEEDEPTSGWFRFRFVGEDPSKVEEVSSKRRAIDSRQGGGGCNERAFVHARKTISKSLIVDEERLTFFALFEQCSCLFASAAAPYPLKFIVANRWWTTTVLLWRTTSSPEQTSSGSRVAHSHRFDAAFRRPILQEADCSHSDPCAGCSGRASLQIRQH